MKNKHYVYLLINTKPEDDRKYYIGCRSCDCNPKEDIYYSSSKTIKKIIKEQGNFFEKKVLMELNTRSEAILYEILMHNKYNVDKNTKFYNISKQTSSKFDTTGFIFVDGVKISTFDYKLSNKKYHSKNKVSLVDASGKKYYIDVNDPIRISKNLVGISTNTVPVLNEKTGKFYIINKKDYNKKIHKTSNYNKAPVVDSEGKRFLVGLSDDRYINGDLISVHKNKVICKDFNNKTFYIDKEKFKEGGYLGINAGNINKEKNPNAKTIIIYNNKGEIKFICKGDFKEVCKKNNLPFISLAKSYRNNGSKIYSTTRGNVEAIKKGNEIFIGWYALVIKI